MLGVWFYFGGYRREVTGFSLVQRAHVDAIAGVCHIDWSTLLYKENVGDILGYAALEPTHTLSPSPWAWQGFRNRSPGDDSWKGSFCLSLAGASSKRRHSHDAEGSSHCSFFKKRKTSPPIASEAKVEEGEVPLDRRSSRHRTNSNECLFIINFYFLSSVGCDLVTVLGFIRRWQILK